MRSDLETREVMNVHQAAHYLGVSSDALYKYVAARTIPAFKLGNRWRFKRSLLDRWIEEQCTIAEGSPLEQLVTKATRAKVRKPQ